MRSSGRGRNGGNRRPSRRGLYTAVFMCLQSLFHPQDLLAMGLILLVFRVRSATRGPGRAFAGSRLHESAVRALGRRTALRSRSRKRRLAFHSVGARHCRGDRRTIDGTFSGRALRVALTGSGQGGSLVRSIPWELHLTSSGANDVLRALPVITVVAWPCGRAGDCRTPSWNRWYCCHCWRRRWPFVLSLKAGCTVTTSWPARSR